MSRLGQDNRFEAIDKTALYNALLALRQCPRCRRDLLPVAGSGGEVWGCNGLGIDRHIIRERGGLKLAGLDRRFVPDHPFETWHLIEEA